MRSAEPIKKLLDELQSVIIAHIAERGVKRVITQEIFEELLAKWYARGKKELEGYGPEESSEASDFNARATILTADGYEADINVAYGEGMKRRMMFALSETCRAMLAQGVIFRNVYTGAKMEELAKRMGLNLPDPNNHQKMDYFEDKMWTWIEKNYGKPRIAALPAELRFDGLIVAGFGPKLHEHGLTGNYRWKDGKIEWTDFPPEGECRIELIPRWWQ
jgi:hypothetical protein